MDAKVLRAATTHDLRHTALKDLADRTGGDMRLVKEFAGHASIETSSIYTRTRLTDLLRAVR
jgi:integrase